MKKAFTIVELMLVIAIIAVLMGLVFTAASDSAKAGRATRTTALCASVQSGLASYYAQFAEWPGSLGTKIANGSIRSRNNNEGVNNNSDDDRYVLSGTEVREMVKALVDQAKEGNPLMDISGLFVSRSTGEPGTKGHGMDFMLAIRGTRESQKKMKTAEMYFGYPDAETGLFRRFKMVYSIPTDQISVMKQ